MTHFKLSAGGKGLLYRTQGVRRCPQAGQGLPELRKKYLHNQAAVGTIVEPPVRRMSSTDPTQPQPDTSPPEPPDATSIVLTDSVIGGLIRESVRRHVPVAQVVAERRGKCEGPHASDPPRPMTVAVPVRRSFWSRCLRLFRSGR